MCNPDNPKLNFVNFTELKICGIPPTSTNTTTPAANNNATLPTADKQSGFAAILQSSGIIKCC